MHLLLGTKIKHGLTPAVSASAVDVRMVSGNVSRSDEVFSTVSTTATPGYSAFENSNTGDKVMYKLSDDGNSVEFVISGKPQGPDSWIAVGFSYDPYMVNNILLLYC